MSALGNMSQSSADILCQFLPTSPYVGHLGIHLTDMQPDMASLTLPFADSLITIGTTMVCSWHRCRFMIWCIRNK